MLGGLHLRRPLATDLVGECNESIILDSKRVSPVATPLEPRRVSPGLASNASEISTSPAVASLLTDTESSSLRPLKTRQLVSPRNSSPVVVRSHSATANKTERPAFVPTSRPLRVGPAATVAPTRTEVPKSSWKIAVDRSSGEQLGIDLDVETMVIDAVLPDGLIAAWNEEHPRDTVMKGDRFDQVNGTSNHTKMLDECKQLKLLTILIKRGAPERLRATRKRVQRRDGHNMFLRDVQVHPVKHIRSENKPFEIPSRGSDDNHVSASDTPLVEEGPLGEAPSAPSDEEGRLSSKEEAGDEDPPDSQAEAGSLIVSSRDEDPVDSKAETGSPRSSAQGMTSAAGNVPLASPISSLADYLLEHDDYDDYDTAEDSFQVDQIEPRKVDTEGVDAEEPLPEPSAPHDASLGDLLRDLADDIDDYDAVDDEFSDGEMDRDNDDLRINEEQSSMEAGRLVGGASGQFFSDGDATSNMSDTDLLRPGAAQEKSPSVLQQGTRSAVAEPNARAKTRWDASWEAPTWASDEKPWVEEPVFWSAKRAKQLVASDSDLWPGEPQEALEMPPSWDNVLFDVGNVWPGEAPLQNPQETFRKKLSAAPVPSSPARSLPLAEKVQKPFPTGDPELRVVRIVIPRGAGDLGIKFKENCWPPEVADLDLGFQEMWSERGIYQGDVLIEVDCIATERSSMSRIQELLNRRPVILVFRRSIINQLTIARHQIESDTSQESKRLQQPHVTSKDALGTVDSFTGVEPSNLNGRSAISSPRLPKPESRNPQSASPRLSKPDSGNPQSGRIAMLPAIDDSLHSARDLHTASPTSGLAVGPHKPKHKRDSLLPSRGSAAREGWRVVVTVLGARGIRKADRFGVCDPFCVCNIAGKETSGFQTKVLGASWNPDWNHSAELSGYTEGDSIEFSVWDHSTKGKGLLGKAMLLPVQFFPRGFDGELTLSDSWHGSRGMLSIKIGVWDHAEIPELESPESNNWQYSQLDVPEKSSVPTVPSVPTIYPTTDASTTIGIYGHQDSRYGTAAEGARVTEPAWMEGLPPSYAPAAGAPWAKQINRQLDNAAELLSQEQIRKMERLTRQAETAARCAERARLAESGTSKQIKESIRRAEFATVQQWHQCESQLEQQAQDAINLADKLRFEEFVYIAGREEWEEDKPERNAILTAHAKEVAHAEHEMRLSELKCEKESQLAMLKTQSIMWQQKQEAVVQRVKRMAHNAEVALENSRADEELAFAQEKTAERIAAQTRLRRTEDAMALALNESNNFSEKAEQAALQRRLKMANEYAVQMMLKCERGGPEHEVASFLAERRRQREAEWEAEERAREAEAAAQRNAELQAQAELRSLRDEVDELRNEEAADQERMRNLHLNSMEDMFVSILGTERDRHAKQLQDEREMLDKRLQDAQAHSLHRAQAIELLQMEVAGLRGDVSALPHQLPREEDHNADVWTIHVDRSGGEPLGIRASLEVVTGSLEVLYVGDDGVIADWNALNPDLAVRRGDRIVAVNNQAGSRVMETELTQFGHLDITLSRSRIAEIAPPLPPPAAAPEEPQEVEWTIQLDRRTAWSGGVQALGGVLVDTEDETLTILTLGTSGLLPGWNAANSQQAAVMPGDRLKSVNRQPGIAHMKEELGKLQILEILIARLPGRRPPQHILTWSIQLDRRDGQQLGVSFGGRFDDALTIASPPLRGLIKSFSKDNPARAIRMGDIFTLVNGSSDPASMKEQLGKPQVLTINAARDLKAEASDSDPEEEIPNDAEINKVDKHGRNILHRLARRGEEEKCLDLLLNPAFTSANIKDKHGNRPLHYAAQSGLADVCEVLCEQADFDVDEDKNHDGLTPHDIAEQQGNLSLVRIIQAAGANHSHPGW